MNVVQLPVILDTATLVNVMTLLRKPTTAELIIETRWSMCYRPCACYIKYNIPAIAQIDFIFCPCIHATISQKWTLIGPISHHFWLIMAHLQDILKITSRHCGDRPPHGKGNIVILMKFSSMTALKVVKMTISSAVNDEKNPQKWHFGFCTR